MKTHRIIFDGAFGSTQEPAQQQGSADADLQQVPADADLRPADADLQSASTSSTDALRLRSGTGATSNKLNIRQKNTWHYTILLPLAILPFPAEVKFWI